MVDGVRNIVFIEVSWLVAVGPLGGRARMVWGVVFEDRVGGERKYGYRLLLLWGMDWEFDM